MKKLSFLFTLIFLNAFLMLLYAQPKAGFKAGVNAASLSSFDGSHRTGIHAGLFASLNIDKHWRFQQELLYSSEGQQYSVEGSKRTIALGYVHIPMMIQYFPVEKFYLEFGPQMGFLAHASSSGDDIPKLNVKRSFRNNQFALSAGAGVQINKGLNFYGRYQLGLTDVTYGEVIDHSRVIMVGLSLRFIKKQNEK